MTKLARLSPSVSRHKKTLQAEAGRVKGILQPGVFRKGLLTGVIGNGIGYGAVEL